MFDMVQITRPKKNKLTTMQIQNLVERGSFISASADCGSKNVCVLPVIVAELELGNIEAHVFAAELVDKNCVTRGSRAERRAESLAKETGSKSSRKIYD